MRSPVGGSFDKFTKNVSVKYSDGLKIVCSRDDSLLSMEHNLSPQQYFTDQSINVLAPSVPLGKFNCDQRFRR